jgi:uncharacterized protein
MLTLERATAGAARLWGSTLVRRYRGRVVSPGLPATRAGRQHRRRGGRGGGADRLCVEWAAVRWGPVGNSIRMPSLAADERAWPAVLKAGWLKQTFVHWPFPPADVQALLPRGLLVDEYDGMAWVSLTPFLMTGVRPIGVQVEPGVTTFPETNLRTYVHRPNGRDGIWFLSLEAGSAATLAARFTVGAPYHLGDLSVSEYDGTVAYAGARRGGKPSYHLVVRPGEPIQLADRDIWLTGRWRSYTRRFGFPVRDPCRARAVAARRRHHRATLRDAGDVDRSARTDQ